MWPLGRLYFYPIPSYFFLLKVGNFGTGSRMSCATFNVGASLNLHGCTKHGISRPVEFGHHCTSYKFSSLFLDTFNLSLTCHSFGPVTRSRSFHSLFKCSAQNSEPSASVGVETKKNSRKHCTLLTLFITLVFVYDFINQLLPLAMACILFLETLSSQIIIVNEAWPIIICYGTVSV